MNSDIIEIKVFDFAHNLFYKGEAKIKNKKEFKQLNNDLKHKAGLQLTKEEIKEDSGWFD